jgi:nicotinamidase-related amidase
MEESGRTESAPRSAHAMALDREGTALVVIDVQDRLFPAMDADHREEVVGNLKILIAAARRLGVPTLVTEQYPKGLGHTLPELRSALAGDVEPIAKVAFSCSRADGFRTRLEALKIRRVILSGIEAHVCVLMSALDLLSEGLAVHVAADAVTSRTQANWRLAMDYLRQAGAVVTATETVVFQLLGKADTDEFRELSRLIR